MVKKLSKEEISQINFIRTFDDSVIYRWSIFANKLYMVVDEHGISYTVILSISDFVARWFVQLWIKRLAHHCPPCETVFIKDYSSVKSADCFSYNDNLINEMFDSDLC